MIATSSTIAIASMMRDRRYANLDDDQKYVVEQRLGFVLRVDAAAKRRPALLAETRRPIAGETFSEGALRKLYYEKWLASGRDWWSLRNAAKVQDDTETLPKEFLLFWHKLCFRKGGRRRAKAAHRELERLWRAGEKIDGYPDRDRPYDLPRGLSYDNLMRKKYRPKPIADTIAAIGLKAAYPHLPGLLTTRVGLPFGSRYVFDDLKHDTMCSLPGQHGARELWQFHVLELLSGYQVARGYKPAALNLKEDRMEKLKERELLFLMAHLLCEHGYNPQGCILQMERGTTTVREATANLLEKFSGGMILVQKGSTSDGALAPGLYGGTMGGNPRFKAALESLGHLVHIETDDRLLLPMPTGSNARLNRPEDYHGKEKHLTLLQRAALALPADQRELLRLTAPPVWQAINLIDAIQERMNWREDHELEGWEGCGFLLPMYRLHEHQAWEPQTTLTLLAPDERAIFERRIRENPKLSYTRRLSPGEVFHGYSSQLTRLPAHALPALIGMEYADEKRVGKDGDFHFEDENIGPDEHHYAGTLHDNEGKSVRLPSGEKYAVFVSAINPLRMYLCDARGRYLGWCDRMVLPNKADAQGMARAYGRRQQEHVARLAPVLAAAQPLWQRQRENNDINDTVFAQAKGAPDEMPKAQRPTKASADLSRHLAEMAAQQLGEK